MNRSLALCILAAAVSAHADYYPYGGRIDTYDPVTGVYYKAVSAKEPVGFMSSKTEARAINLAITTPSSGETVLLFQHPLSGSLSDVLFETGFKDGAIEFFGPSGGFVLNNENVPKREPKDRMLVIVKSKTGDSRDLYVCGKDGSDLEKVTTIAASDDWHIDVKNSKIRIVHQRGNGIAIDNHDW